MAGHEVLRILDANANRAREALRVAEDYARFALDSPRLAGALKSLRHRLRACLDSLGVPPSALLAARDTPGDVGTVLMTQAECQRAGAADVARAALKRLEEALRCLEEFGKTLDADAARGIEAIRYEAYALEQQLFHPTRPALDAARLYVLLDPAAARGRDILAVGRAALRGGADVVQLRTKGVPDAQWLAWARALREATREHGALLVINDRADIALLADADGVHLGAGDLPVRDARRLLGPDGIIGATANSIELAQQAEAAGADYVGCGAMFASSTKPDREAVGPGRLAEVAAAVRVPVFAIGGITVERLAPLLAAGCQRVAVCAGVIAAEDVEAAARAFAQRLKGQADA